MPKSERQMENKMRINGSIEASIRNIFNMRKIPKFEWFIPEP